MPRTAQYDRQAALQAAIALFWRRGYYATSLKDIERELDMRPGSLYSAFGSKQGLFVEALDAYTATMADDVQNHIAASGGVLSGVMAYLRWLLLGQKCPALAATPACMVVKTLLESTGDEDPLRGKATELLRRVELGFTAALEQAKSAGELRPDVDCERLARLLQTQVMGVRSFAQSGASERQLKQLLEDIEQVFLSYRQAH
ncbi:TetR/AcrR family transcriptional regulator [Gilvimarinus agarilyticus]|uniref:TetR/AcrR family transcriptional regulator n=1 Tax=Gilvimarinus agarilyticus TaxID=679259 RepID=UPI0005A298F1|nr:TetR/AcrR family transcriptional regulator [Gilvimarinus agarilyticus]